MIFLILVFSSSVYRIQKDVKIIIDNLGLVC